MAAPRITGGMVLTIITIVLSVGGSWGLFSSSMGSLKTTVIELKSRAIEDRIKSEALAQQRQADHDLIIQMAADIKYIKMLAKPAPKRAER